VSNKITIFLWDAVEQPRAGKNAWLTRESGLTGPQFQLSIFISMCWRCFRRSPYHACYTRVQPMRTKPNASILRVGGPSQAPSRPPVPVRPAAILPAPHPMILQLAGLLARIEYAEAQLQLGASGERV
jgi:hypothetical protein